MTRSSSRKQSFAMQNIYFRKVGLRSRGAHRTSPRKELKSRYTPPILTNLIVKGAPLTIPTSIIPYMGEI